MKTRPDDALSMRVGERSIAENLQRAIASGAVIEDDDGSLRLSEVNRAPAKVWMSVPNGPALGCEFLKHFLFRHAYDKSVAPNRCRPCYKVKVTLRSLRELVAGWELAKGIQCRSKWGLDFYNPYSQSIYAGLFYVAGLEGARATYQLVREAFDKDPKLGPEVPMTIKRGCSEYEALLAPSGRYVFPPELAEAEELLALRFRPRARTEKNNLLLAHWIAFAHQIGDNTYLDFTGGNPLYAKTVDYSVK